MPVVVPAEEFGLRLCDGVFGCSDLLAVVRDQVGDLEYCTGNTGFLLPNHCYSSTAAWFHSFHVAILSVAPLPPAPIQ